MLLCCAGEGAATEEGSSSGSYLLFDYDGYGNSKLKTPIEGLSPDGKLFVSELFSDFSVVARRPGNGMIKGSLLFSWLSLDFTDFAAADTLPRFGNTLYSDLVGTYRGHINDDWGGQARLAPGLAGDLTKSVDSRDFTLAGGFWAVRYYGGSFVGVGAVHTYDFGEPMFLPSIIGEYRTEHWFVDVELPTLAMATYLLDGGFDIGAIFRADGHRYALDPAKYGVADPFLAHSEPTIGVFGVYEFDDRLSAYLETGYAFARRFRVLDDARVVLDLDPENSWYVRMALRVGSGVR